MDDLYREYIDIEVEAPFQLREYLRTQSSDIKRFRFVGIHNEDANGSHFYITNMP